MIYVKGHWGGSINMLVWVGEVRGEWTCQRAPGVLIGCVVSDQLFLAQWPAMLDFDQKHFKPFAGLGNSFSAQVHH